MLACLFHGPLTTTTLSSGSSGQSAWAARQNNVKRPTVTEGAGRFATVGSEKLRGGKPPSLRLVKELDQDCHLINSDAASDQKKHQDYKTHRVF